jgi:hypothetical protein
MVVPLSVNTPDDDVLARFCRMVLKPNVGLPEMPSALDRVMPEPTANERLVTVLALSLTINPVLAAFRLDADPVMLIVTEPPAPESVKDSPVVVSS